jgi:hypothetical protein
MLPLSVRALKGHNKLAQGIALGFQGIALGSGATARRYSVIMRRFSAGRAQELALAENPQPKTNRRRKIGEKMILLLIEHRDEGSPCRARRDRFRQLGATILTAIPVHSTADVRIPTTGATSKSPK